MIEFKKFQKIGRGDALPIMVTITEKIDGMNACVVIKDGKIVAVQSRNKFLNASDGTGLFEWAHNNSDELAIMGDGYHYGEWAGPGIQKNRHGIEGKNFFLFNTYRWGGGKNPVCCAVVPVLYEGELEATTIQRCMDYLMVNTVAQQTPAHPANPEGIVVYYHFFDKYTKHTFKEKGK